MISRIHHEAENASNKVRMMGKRSRGLGTGATRSFTVSRSLIARRKKKKKNSSFRVSFDGVGTESTCQRDCTLEDVQESRPRRNFPTKCSFFLLKSLVPSFPQNLPSGTTLFGFTKTTGRKTLDQKESTMSRAVDSRRCGVRVTMVLYRISSDSTEKKKVRTG